MKRQPAYLAIVAALFAQAASAPGCTPAAPPSSPTKAPSSSGPAGPLFETPARWVAYPATVGETKAVMILPDGRCLVTTDDGQRWLLKGSEPSTPCKGTGEASGSPALESLVGVTKTSDEYRFVADGGAVYASREPNGPFTRYTRAPTVLRRVSAQGSTIVGVDGDGATFFYDAGAWKPAAVPEQSHAIDIVANAQGQVLWLGAPEKLLVSSDGGHTFAAPSSAPATLGLHAGGFTSDGKLAARGLTGNVVLDGSSVTPTKQPVLDLNVPDVQIEPTIGPRASLLLEQRAVLDGPRYYEILDAVDGSRWGLSSGQLGNLLEKKPLEKLESCENVKVSASGSVLVFGCTKEVEMQPSLAAEIWVSRDGGKTMDLLTTLATPTFTDLSFAVNAEGTTLVLGACKAPGAKTDDKSEADKDKSKDEPARSEESSICTPKAPLVLRGDKVTVGTVPYLEENSAHSPILSPDGRTAYFLGRNRRDSMPAVFVSRDGGHAYQLRAIEAPQSSSWDQDETGDVDAGYVRPLYVSDGVTLSMDETGTLGTVGERDAGYAWVTFDADGRIANIGEPPEPSYMIGGAGNRVLAVTFGQMDGVLRSWESLDGGITWAEVATTPAVQRYGERGGAFTCGSAGCLLGDELVRVGWEGQSETPFAISDDLISTPADPTLGVPVSCQLVPKTDWTPIEGRPEERSTGAYPSYSSGPSMPRMREIMRGKTIFSVLGIADDGKVDITSASLADKESGSPALVPTLTKKPLLGPIKAGKTGIVATTVRSQAEGYVAMRATLPTAKGGGLDTSKKLDAELAWNNQLTNTLAKSRVSFDSWETRIVSGITLKPSLLTIVSQGVIAQPIGKSQAAYVDAHSSFQFDYPNLLAYVTDGRGLGTTDAFYLEGRPYAAMVVDRSPTAQVLMYAPAAAASAPRKLKGDPPVAAVAADATAFTLSPGMTEVDWLYSGERIGFATYVPAAAEGAPTTTVGFFIEADGRVGPAIELPTLADLADRPQPCSVEQRKTTPRVVSPNFGRFGVQLFETGRHPLMITDAPTSATSPLASSSLDPIWMLTDGAILHGTKKDPCVAGWRASGMRPGMVAILGGNLDQSWMLRVTSGMRTQKGTGGRWVQQIEARPMTCRYHPDLSVPYELMNRANQRFSDDQP